MTNFGENPEEHFYSTDGWSVGPRKPGVKIKKLDWENVGRCIGWSEDRETTHLWIGKGLRFVYRVAVGKEGWWLSENKTPGIKSGFTSYEEAKAAAQADYERRIRSALE